MSIDYGLERGLQLAFFVLDIFIVFLPGESWWFFFEMATSSVYED